MRNVFYEKRLVWVMLLCGLFFVLSSCTKDLEDDGLGQAYTISDVAKKFEDIVLKMNPNLSTGDFVVQVQNGSIAGNDLDAEIVTRLDVYETQTADCYGDGSEGLQFYYLQTQQQKINGKLEKFKTDLNACLGDMLSDTYAIFLADINYPSSYSNTFYNINYSVAVEDAPQVIQDAGCPGMTSCKMRVYSLDFQQKVITPEGEEGLYHHQYKISPDVPWLARTLEYCISVKIELDGTEYPLQQCVHSTNFGNSSSAD
ncbi:MAG: hypothetical protein VX642_08145 [Bdellovibrionota bacterium]|nr:hypothetical protein [Bdellovibrionota bacterium]